MVVASILRPQADGELKEELEIGIIDGWKEDEQTKGRLKYVIRLKDDVLPKTQWEEQILDKEALEVLVETTYFQICDRVVSGITEVDSSKWFTVALKKFLYEEAFIPAGRILTGVGNPELNLTFFNCFVKKILEDSCKGIADHWASIFEIFRRGGGCGWNLSILRPRNAPVKGVNGKSSGVCSWATHFAAITNTVEQGGSRRGASLQAIDIWHPDVIEYIRFKSARDPLTCPSCQHQFSKERNLWKGSNVSIILSDDFMKAVKEDAPWDLIFPDTSDPDYNKVWDGDIEKWKKLRKPVIVYRTIPAKELWDLFVDNAWTCGDPGVLFLDRSNYFSNSWYYNKLICTNPCVVGSSLIYTADGIKPARQAYLEGGNQKVVVDGRFGRKTILPSSSVFKTGKKTVYRLQTKEGYYLLATADHRVMTPHGWVEIQNLTEGDTLHILNRRGGFGTKGSAELGYVLGWLIADGHLSGDQAWMNFHGKKMKLAEKFAQWTYSLVKDEGLPNRDYSVTPTTNKNGSYSSFGSSRLLRVLRNLGIKQKKINRVPQIIFQSTEATQRAFLRALFSADGTVNYNPQDPGRRCSIRLSSVSRRLIETTQQLLLNFGIESKVNWGAKPAGKAFLPDGKGGEKEYETQELHELIISKQSMATFAADIGFMLRAKQRKVDSYLDTCSKGPYSDKFVARVDSITKVGVRTVYDLTEPKTHSFIANGLVVHNCGEQVLPENGICNLGHLNLPKFLVEKSEAKQFPKSGNTASVAKTLIDLPKLMQAIRVGVRFLDTVIDINKYHDDRMEKTAKDERRIGLGILGYGELLIRCGLEYGSAEALKFTSWLFEEIRTASYMASIELSKEKGPFRKYNSKKYLAGKFIQTLPVAVRKAIQKHGIRNVTLNTVAPTGSVGTMVGTSTGFEPYYSFQYTARSRIGSTNETFNIFEELAKRFGEDSSSWPSYVVASDDISLQDQVSTQACIQEFIDSSISKTINFPEEATREDVSKAFMLMYDSGCKGGTIYRDKSKDEQVLYKKEKPAKDKIQSLNIEGIESIQDDQTRIVFIDSSECTSLLRAPLIRQKSHSISDSIETPVGKLHAFLRFHPITGEPYDFFCQSGKGDVSADVQAFGRLISVILRWPDKMTIPQEVRLQILVNQLCGIHGRSQVGIGPEAVYSLPDAIGKFLNDYLAADFPLPGIPLGEEKLDEFARRMTYCHNKEQLVEFVKTGIVKDGCGCGGEDCACKKQELIPEIEEAVETKPSPPKGRRMEYCPRCGNASLIKIPGHCTYCTNQQCNYSEC